MHSKNKIFTIHGGGNIGLGLIADVVSKSSMPYQIIATSDNQFFSKLIHSASDKFWLHHGSEINATTVQHVSLIKKNSKNIIQLYTDAHLAAICLTPHVLTKVASDIAKGLINRFNSNQKKLTILIVMNIPQCEEFAKNIITDRLQEITRGNDQTEAILAKIKFLPVIVDRIVTKRKKEDIILQLRKQLTDLMVKHPSIKMTPQKIEAILTHETKLFQAVQKYQLQFNLFNAEKAFSIYTNTEFAEAYQFPDIKVSRYLDQIETLKNKYMNGPHAILAWTGAMLGYKTIAEAAANPHISEFIKHTMHEEIRPILQIECPNISKQDLEDFEKRFFKRCLTNITDTVTRVGRDPLRKLKSGGHIQGVIELNRKHNLKTSTKGLEQGIAMGILYAVRGLDLDNQECQKIAELYEKHRSYSAVLHFGKILSFTNVNSPAYEDKMLYRILHRIYTCEKLHTKQKFKLEAGSYSKTIEYH